MIAERRLSFEEIDGLTDHADLLVVDTRTKKFLHKYFPGRIVEILTDTVETRYAGQRSKRVQVGNGRVRLLFVNCEGCETYRIDIKPRRGGLVYEDGKAKGDFVRTARMLDAAFECHL